MQLLESFPTLKMKDFYINALGLEFVSEEMGRHIFLKAGQSMLLIFNPNKMLTNNNNIRYSL